jgi:hypothetical protein
MGNEGGVFFAAGAGRTLPLRTIPQRLRLKRFIIILQNRIFRKVVVPSSARWSHHFPQGGHTIFRKVVTPSSARW